MHHFVKQHQRVFKPEGPSWLQELRQKAIQHFEKVGFPSTKNEAWKYTNVKPLGEIPFALGKENNPEAVQYDELKCMRFGKQERIRITFVNGHFSPEHSMLDGLPPQVKVLSLREAILKFPDKIQSHLGRVVSYQNNPFAALNTAFLNDGAFIHIEKNEVLEKPIELLYLSLSNGSPSLSHPRNLVIADENSQVVLLETYAGKRSDNPYFTNAVTEVVAKSGAIIDHYKLQDECEQSYHLRSFAIEQNRDSAFNSYNFTLGALLSRNEIIFHLGEPGSQCNLSGLYMAKGRQHVDNQTLIDHAVPHCSSRELYKGILDDRSHGVFNGQINVHPKAQKTVSSLTNNNLLLSKEALIDTKPLLEIYANDVKCSHGVTIGRLDENQVFYLRSRGLDEEIARNLLTYGFASEVIHEIKVPSLRSHLEEVLLNRLQISELSVEGDAA